MLERVRRQRPLIHHITNYVVMNDTANVTLHLGALPVMAHAIEEVSDMVSMAGALVLNPGTLTAERIESMLTAGHRANEMAIPIVLDPVGAGATAFRTDSNLELLNALRISVVRGNSGEVGTLAGAGGVVRGVESVQATADPASAAQSLAHARGCIVAITGQRDIVADASRTLVVDNGHHWLSTNTGTGCMATTAVAVFCAVENDRLLATAAGLACFGLAAEIASKKASGPASFKVALLDALYDLQPQTVAEGVRISHLHDP
jgi:hydroxyethylthiazole kinase